MSSKSNGRTPRHDSTRAVGYEFREVDTPEIKHPVRRAMARAFKKGRALRVRRTADGPATNGSITSWATLEAKALGKVGRSHHEGDWVTVWAASEEA
jgi:hypothetical protein